MPGFRHPGVQCVTAALPNDPGTLHRGLHIAPITLGTGVNGPSLHKKPEKRTLSKDIPIAADSKSKSKQEKPAVVESPELKGLATELLASDAIKNINFVLPRKDKSDPADKGDPDLNADIKIDSAFFSDLGDFLAIHKVRFYLVPDDDPILEGGAGRTKPADNGRVSVNLSNTLTGYILKSNLVHELIHAELLLTGKEDMYWALGEACSYVGGEYFLLLSQQQYPANEKQLFRSAYEMAGKAKRSTDHLLETSDVRNLIAQLRATSNYKRNSPPISRYWENAAKKH